MTVPTRSHGYTAPSTSMHLAAPTSEMQVPPGYGVRFGLAAVVLSLLGVPDSEWSRTAIAEQAAARQAVGQTEVAQASRPAEWHDWKPIRDLG